MKTTTRKTASKIPFKVPAPVEKALKTAGNRFDAFSVKARSVASKTEKQVKVAAKDLKKTGQSFAKDPRAFVEDVMESGRDLGKKLQGVDSAGAQALGPQSKTAQSAWRSA